MFNKIYNLLFNKKKVEIMRYPNKYNENNQDRIINIADTITDVADTKTAILTIIPNGITPYTVYCIYILNIIGNICVVDLHVEAVAGEGMLSSNKRDSKTYTGTETYGGYIDSYSSYTTSYIQITNQSGGDLSFAFNAVVAGDVSYTLTKTT